MKALLKPGQILFVGVTDPIHPKVESVGDIVGRIREAAGVIPVAQLGTTDDCGFSPFADDTSTSRDIAFAKIANRVAATERASKELGV
jgi:5-methyltetrahydropteroyltriglutamate--homocysteine methyltransferase